MASSPYDGLYWDTHLPLGLYKSLQDLMDSNKKNPNTPNSKVPSSERQWLSLPRSADSYSKKHSVYTFADSADFFITDNIFKLINATNQTVTDSGDFDYSQFGYGAQIARSLDPGIFNWFPIAYNADPFPLNLGVEAAVEKTVSMILNSNSKVFLIGHGRGAVVASLVYQEFCTGRLSDRKSNLLGVYNFGNPMREQGHTVPGGTDPGGHGIAPERLTNTESLVWEFAAPRDPMSSMGDDITGQAASLLYTKFNTLIDGPATLKEQLSHFVSTAVHDTLFPFKKDLQAGQPLHILKLMRSLWKEFFDDGGAHDNYQNFYPIAGSKLNAIETTIVSIQNITMENPPEIVNSSATEVLSVNYRQPVSISEISFETLRKSSYLEIWYLDRSNNWRQLLKENSSPITLKVGHSESMSWYKFSTYTYPVVAKAIQFRITRVSDPIVGDMAYPVGIKNTLVRRNVYNRPSGLQHMEDETDALGNIVSKVVKDWDAAKAIDDNATTFWRSAPQPDPNAVVCFYLDTRDGEGNAQLIDKIYLDPVHSGQSLNLYYSNDETVTTKKLNPSSLIPSSQYQIASTLDASGTGSTATLTLDTSPNLNIGDEVQVTGVLPLGYNGIHVISAVSRTYPYSISFPSSATGVQNASGVVMVKGQDNFDWSMGKGLKDNVPDDGSTSVYRCPLSVGPMVSQDCWFGIQWTPSFDAYEQKSNIIPISTKAVSKIGGTATISLGAAPNVSVGSSITITGMQPSAYNGTHTVTAVSNAEPYSVSFQTSATGAQTQSGILVTNNFTPGITASILAASGNGATATITLDSDPKVVAGELITISGVTPSQYNGTHVVTGATTSAPWTVSFASGVTQSQTTAGKATTNTKVKIVGVSSPNYSDIFSVYDFTTGSLLYSKSKDQNKCIYDANTKILRIPAENVPSECLASDSISIYLGTNGPAPTELTLLEVLPSDTEGGQCWPRIFYDTDTAEITLEMFQPNGGTPLVHSAALENLFSANTTINIVVGWKYLSGSNATVYISACTSQQNPLVSKEITSIDFPTKISLDGKVGFRQWRGIFGAHIIKQESYSLSSNQFLANPLVYCNPDPVLVSSSSTTSPASSLDHALMAVDWTSQQFAAGGAHSSSYSDKEWTPIWVNYFAEKGFLYLPETTSMKYLKMEFSQLTPEPYPVYDQGIKVVYQTYPVTITQTSTQARGLVGVIDNIFGGIGSVNWLNPSTVNQATNSIFGRTVQPVQTTIQVGPGAILNALPNTTQTAISESTRAEANSPWVYRRTPVSSRLLVQNYLGSLLSHSNQGIKSLPVSQQETIQKQTTVTSPTAASPAALPIQGQDWYVFPGQTLRMPANVVDGVTNSQVVTTRLTNKSVRTRFTTIAVHQYETKTVTLDASIAYFAGIREVQPYVVTYIDYEDPPEFAFDNYDPAVGWSLVNIKKVGTGPITANPNPYDIPNRRFNATINYWSGEGWNWDSSEGYSLAETWQPGTPFVYGSAHTTANGSNLSLLSGPVNVNSGAYVKFIAWVVYRNISYSPGAKIFVDAVGLDENDNVIAPNINLGEYMEIKDGQAEIGTPPDQYFFSENQPCSSVPQIGIKAIPLYGSVDLNQVSGSIRKIRLRLNVNESVTAGDVWFDDIDMYPGAGIIGSVEKTINTKSKFSKVRCRFSDSGTKRSDPMWAFLDTNDPRRTILTHYTTTIPSAMPDGTWADSFGTWADSNVEWGTPYSVVSVNYSEAVYDKKRVIHFFRKASSLNSQTGQAGIAVRQSLNFVPGALFRICATFFKGKKTDNTMELRLTRVSGIEAGPEGPEQYPNGIIHSETLRNGEDTKESIISSSSNLYPTGRWHTHEGQWVEIPEGQDQVYRLEFTLSGNAEDDIYLNDLWVEIAHVRYYIRLGGGINHDVTALAYRDNCTVGTTEEVTQMRIQVEIHGSNSFAGRLDSELQQAKRENESFAYSSVFTPLYLQ